MSCTPLVKYVVKQCPHTLAPQYIEMVIWRWETTSFSGVKCLNSAKNIAESIRKKWTYIYFAISSERLGQGTNHLKSPRRHSLRRWLLCENVTDYRLPYIRPVPARKKSSRWIVWKQRHTSLWLLSHWMHTDYRANLLYMCNRYALAYRKTKCGKVETLSRWQAVLAKMCQNAKLSCFRIWLGGWTMAKKCETELANATPHFRPFGTPPK